MCLVDGCEALPKRRGMCYMHYKRWLRHGDPPDNVRRDALHKCGNGHEGCCNKRHVKWGTHSENMFDRWRDHRKRKQDK